MKFYHFLLASVFGFTSLYAATEEINYHGHRLHFGNFGEKNEEIQKRLATSRAPSFILDLSENYLDDSCVETLSSTLSSEKVLDHLVILNLQNNRISYKGLLMLSPLLMKETFQWLVVPINSFDMEGIRTLSSTLETFARKKSEEEGSDENVLRDRWLSKVIWLPGTYNFDKLPISSSSKESHKKYYKQLSEE